MIIKFIYCKDLVRCRKTEISPKRQTMVTKSHNLVQLASKQKSIIPRITGGDGIMLRLLGNPEEAGFSSAEQIRECLPGKVVFKWSPEE